jgi:signal transduction histidine kinase
MTPRKPADDTARDGDDLTLVLDSIPEIVASFDRDGHLLYLNASGRRWLRLGEGELSTALLSDLLPEPAAERLLGEALPEAARTGRWAGPGELLPRGGKPIPVTQQLLGHPPDDESRIAFTLVAIPVEDPIVDQETIVATSLGFLHDLNNLLGPIIAYADLAQDKLDASHPVQRYLAQIQGAAERARGLSERVLKRMRPREDDSRPVVIAELIREVVSWLRTEHPSHEVEIESPLSDRGIVGDAVGLQQMVLNLCKNAVEALPPEGGKVWIAVRDVEGRPELRLTVRDNGHGMDEAVLARIFEPFFSTKPGGTGVGLSIAREVVRRHRGTMTIESAQGSGTSFHVQLPIDEAS